MSDTDKFVCYCGNSFDWKEAREHMAGCSDFASAVMQWRDDMAAELVLLSVHRQLSAEETLFVATVEREQSERREFEASLEVFEEEVRQAAAAEAALDRVLA